MKTRIITVCFLFLQLLFAGCSKEEAIDNVDPDVPEVEIPEEDMEIAIQNLERVEEAMSPLFLASENAEELALHLDEIKVMEGVEDAYVCDETTLAIRVEGGITTYYYYPPEPVSVDVPELLDESSFRVIQTRSDVCKDKNVLIINQLSNDERFEHARRASQIVQQKFMARNFNVKVVNNEDFTAKTLCEEMPKYGITFLMTHGCYDAFFEGTKKTHWILTGEKGTGLPMDRLEKWKKAMAEKISVPIQVKEMKPDGKKIGITYVAVNELYLKNNIKKDLQFPENSIMFNVACRSLYDNADLWDVLNSKGLGCYLGFDGINSIGISSGTLFFQYLLFGNSVSEAYDWLYDEGYGSQFMGLISLECHPANCDITLANDPEITEEEVVDLGLSVKWRSMNLGASSLLELGRAYTREEFMEIRRELDEKGYDNREPVDISGTEYDFATQTLGAGWRMPTMKDWKELKSECEWKALIQDGVPGFRVTGTNGKSIFLPCTVYIEVEGSELFRTCYASGLINEHWDVESMWLIGNVASIGISGGTQQELEMIDEAFIRPVCD